MKLNKRGSMKNILFLAFALMLATSAQATTVYQPIKPAESSRKKISLVPLMNNSALQTIVGASRDVTVIFDGSDSVRVIENVVGREISRKVRPQKIQDKRDEYGCLTLQLTPEYKLSECTDNMPLYWVLEVNNESIPMELATPAFSIQIQ